MNLPSDRWLPRLLHWKPVGQCRVGRPRQQWDDMLRTFCRYKRLGEWELAARDGRNWQTLMPDFILFCSGSCRSTFERHILLLCTGTSFSPVPFMGCLRAYRFHSLTHSLTHWSHASGISSWSKKCMTQYWNFVFYIANLPAERWVRRTLAWQPRPTYPPRGRPPQTWDTKLEMFCRYKALGNWEIVARNAARWDSLLPCFLDFCST